LRSFRLHPDKDIYELILDVATKSTRHAVSIPESRICGMQNGVQILEDVVTILVGEGKSNTVAAWETALGQVRDGMEAIFDFQISIKAHETCMENFYATYACDSTLTTDLNIC
jgi:ethanolamine utilization microcompartment shell protein EutL